MPNETGGYYERLQAALQRLQTAQTDYQTAVSKRDELVRQLEGEEPTVGIGSTAEGSAEATTIDGQIAQQKARLETLLVSYTEKHPEVVALRESIQRLEAQRDAESDSRKRAGGVPSSAGVSALNINPVYQSMRISLSQTELQLVEIRSRLSYEQQEVAKLRSLVSTAPEVEAELVRLNRDYEVDRAQHQALLQRLESARLSDEASATKEEARFRVIEPAVVPLAPVGPNRLLLNSAALFVALGIGLALAFVLHQLRPVFFALSELESALGLPVLGTVVFATEPAAARTLRKQPWLAGGCLALLLVGYLVVMSLATQLPDAVAGIGRG
jgi:polysaccharide chain length determinant protein (PEP-CTERM system associated)